MFRCPKCSPECESYDEVNRDCMYNTKLIDREEALKAAYWDNPVASFDELD